MKIPEGWPTREMVDAAWRGYTGVNATEKLTRAITAALAAAPTPPAPAVALRAWIKGYWMKAYPDDVYVEEIVRHPQENFSGYKWTPLFTRPANDGLRKAAEEYLEFMDRDKDDCFEEIIEFVNRHTKRLRAELDKGKSAGISNYTRNLEIDRDELVKALRDLYMHGLSDRVSTILERYPEGKS